MRMYDSKESLLIESKIKPNLKLIYNMKVNGLSDKYIAKALGISVATFQKLIEVYSVLNDTYNDALEILSSKLSEVVIGRALGTDGREDKEGNLLPPDEKLAFKLLEKFDPRYKQKTEVQNTITIENIIRQVGHNSKSEIETQQQEQNYDSDDYDSDYDSEGGELFS